MPTFIKSFRTKVTIVVILAMFTAGALSNYLIYEYSLRSRFDQLRHSIMVLAQTLALQVDASDVVAVPMNKEGASSVPFKKIFTELYKIKEAAPSLVYIYILEKTPKRGIYRFVIDIMPETGPAVRQTAFPGDEYDGSRFPAIEEAFNAPSADKDVVSDEWGVFLSAYAPIRDSGGNSVAILGIDMSADSVMNLQKEVYKRFVLVLVLGILFSIITGIIISGSVTSRINKLVDGIRCIAKGDLTCRLPLKGQDEISELAKAFNSMVVSLDASKEKLLHYFYDVVQSFVRVMEARDPYTKGHSDRVAVYSENIGRKLGLAKNRLELLKEAALLHDIGKLGVQEAILNKKMKLTDDERTMINRHPGIGEEVLKPIALDDEMLAVIKQHHEHYDGSGYPAKLKGDRINLLASIVAVADAYDAMTSHRAYRNDLSKKDAIDQLEENKGIQFDPKIVDAFVEVLKE